MYLAGPTVGTPSKDIKTFGEAVLHLKKTGGKVEVVRK